MVRSRFRLHNNLSTYIVPDIKAIIRLVGRFFEREGQQKPKVPKGRTSLITD